MASLWNLILKDKANTAEPLLPAKAGWLDELRQEQPPLVNITELAGTISRRPDSAKNESAQPQDITPCRRVLWLEFLAGKPPHIPPWRQAIEIEREEIDGNCPKTPDGLAIPVGARHRIGFAMWAEQEGIALLWGFSTMFADNIGEPIQDSIFSRCKDPDDAERIRILTSIACEALTIMNTRGTRIEPPFEKRSEVVKPNRAPHSVWHTIHLPKFQAPPLENAVIDGAVLERREHWVRAHRKDYRKGAGMFGRVKALVWVSEFQRGNPELGTVKQSFTVAPRTHA